MSAFSPTTVENDDKKVKQCFNAVLFDMDGVLASVGMNVIKLLINIIISLYNLLIKNKPNIAFKIFVRKLSK
jgi:hypothetical protein